MFKYELSKNHKSLLLLVLLNSSTNEFDDSFGVTYSTLELSYRSRFLIPENFLV